MNKVSSCIISFLAHLKYLYFERHHHRVYIRKFLVQPCILFAYCTELRGIEWGEFRDACVCVCVCRAPLSRNNEVVNVLSIIPRKMCVMHVYRCRIISIISTKIKRSDFKMGFNDAN